MDKNYLIGAFEISDLQKLEEAYLTKSESLAKLLKEMVGKYKKDGLYFDYPGFIYTSSYEDIFDEIEKSIPFLFEENQEFLDELNSIKNSSEENKKWHDALVAFSTYVDKKGGKIFSMIFPNSGDYGFIISPSPAYYLPIILLQHFSDTCNDASGWYEEFMECYKLPYSEFIGSIGEIKPIYEYQVKDDFFGPSFEGNARQINLTEEVYNAAITAMNAAKGYC